ncbi:hypothetical protein AALP_AA3G355800 [Arabis alpina]|uniref:Uncharacterized protein n=1 Tax=Arabis alpina TaxID=50452 RepID=A0A087HDT6_ARAAL|nr:hypothetical protein AALP_AA3G355800 [Arabis alpina]
MKYGVLFMVYLVLMCLVLSHVKEVEAASETLQCVRQQILPGKCGNSHNAQCVEEMHNTPGTPKNCKRHGCTCKPRAGLVRGAPMQHMCTCNVDE